MTKNVYIVLGNGFSIDFIKNIATKDNNLESKIDLVNLFSQGANLKWPQDDKPGFLSFRRTPNLWNIGARSNLSNVEANEILERVVTCANVFALRRDKTILSSGMGNGFLHAYKELVAYLKFLFIHYDSLIPSIPDNVKEWAWAKFFLSLYRNNEIERVSIVSYNYDIWLERILQFLDIPFGLPCIHVNGSAKFQICKPHGSISFLHDKELLIDSFSINYTDLVVDYTTSAIKHSLDKIKVHTPGIFLIPPAGESGRTGDTWAKTIRSECSSMANSLSDSDLVVICGISYWHVDRSEIDSLLNDMKSTVDLLHINPYPSQTLDAVLNSLFSKYTHFTSSNALSDYPL